MIVNRMRVKTIIQEHRIERVDLVFILNNECNADCPLCVAKHAIKNKSCVGLCEAYRSECLRCCERKDTDEEFFTAASDLLSVIHGENVHVILTGGEPTLSARLIPMLKILDGYPFGSVGIESNGAQILDAQTEENLLCRGIELLLSRYAVDDAKNGGLFRWKNMPVTDCMVRRIIKRFSGRVCINCIPLQGGVDNAADLVRFVRYYRELGAESLFTEAMFDVSLISLNPAIAQYYTERGVKIDRLSEELNALGFPKRVDAGRAFHVIAHEIDGRLVKFTAADMYRISRQQQNDDKYSKFIIYPSGEVGVHSVEMR